MGSKQEEDFIEH